MRYGPDGLTVRTGWRTQPPAPAVSPDVAPPAAPVVASSEQAERLQAEIRVLSARLREVEAAQANRPVQAIRASAPAGISPADLRKILTESESRQRTEIALQLAQVWKDFNAARASDFVRMQQTLAPELQRQRTSIENLYRVSLQK